MSSAACSASTDRWSHPPMFHQRRSVAIAGSFEAVEDEVEPELEFVAVVVVGAKHVLDCQFGQVRIRRRRGFEPGCPAASSAVCSGVSKGRLAPAARTRRCSCRGPRMRARPARWRSRPCGGTRGRRRGAAASPGRGRCATPSDRSPSGGATAPGGPRSPADASPSSSRLLADGRSISPKTMSIMPSSRSSLLATWLYSDIASTPSASPSLRMLSDSMPLASARATAALQHPLPAQRGPERSTPSGRAVHL